MKKTLQRTLISIVGIIGCLAVLSFIIFWDAFFTGHFRTTQDLIHASQSIDLRGLKDLHASGGNLVRFADLQHKLSRIQGPKIVVDGMAEFHGYIHGIPTTFFAYQREGKPSLKHLIRRWLITGTLEKRLDLVIPEDIEAKKYGFDYKKLNIGSAFIETNENIDNIVEFFDSQAEKNWLHFHCAHGKGRTSVLLVMWDIMQNAPSVSLQDIVKRQHLLGSEDLFDIKVWKNGTYDKKMLEDRKKFIEDFYAFISQRKPDGIQRWSEWQHSLKR
jgi:hypothetical protein